MKYFSIGTLSLVLTLLIFTQAAQAADEIVWRPITPAELESKKPLVEPDADAEAIFWDITMDDKKTNKLEFHHYVRVKIYTDRGREKFAKMDIPFMKGKKVEGVAARVIKPDGTIIVLQSTEIFEREIVRANKVKVLAKSFAVPGIEPGVIVEYQYSESIKNDSAGGERLTLQRDIPMQQVTYHIRPSVYGVLRVKSYNIPEESVGLNFKEDPDNKGFQVATMKNVPALKEEAYMPPDDEVRRWAFLSYSSNGWDYWARAYGAYLKQFTKASKDIQQKSDQLAAGTGTPQEKLKKIYEFVQTTIRNASYDQSLTDEQREKLDYKNASEVLEKKVGTTMQIDLLFAALASAAGLDTRMLLTGDRSDNFFTPDKYPFTSFIHFSGIAVVVDDNWKYFNPGVPYLPCGEMLWTDEGMAGMLVGPNGMMNWKGIPLSDEKKSTARRTGKFKLLEDGTLEGRVTLEYEGHLAARRRQEGFMVSSNKREDNAIQEAKENIKNGEIASLSISNFEDPSKPLTYVYDVRVPSYAQKTGKRLFLQPGFFEYGATPAFSSSSRNYPIYFSYPWSENDRIELELPKGYVLDSPDSPAEVTDPSKIGSLKIAIGFDKETGVLIYKRSFFFGANAKIVFPANVYQPMKQLFGAFHQADTHTISLKQLQ